MSETTATSGNILPAQIAVAEATLGAALLPEGLSGVPIEANDIRGHASVTIGDMVSRRWGGQGRIPLEEIDLSSDRLAELRADPAVSRLAARVAAANSTLENWHRPPELPPAMDPEHTPRARSQARMLRGIVANAQRAPGGGATPDSPYRDGFLEVAPPGVGKTAIQALTVVYAGIGRPESDIFPEKRLGVGILTSQELIRQYVKPGGLFTGILQAGGRDASVGAFFEGRRDGHADHPMILTTPNSYEEAVRSGAIDTEHTIRYILDEAHRVALAPRMQQHVAGFGPDLYMFTATPAIANGRRDLRRQFPYSQFGTFGEYIRDGILSPMQLFTYRAGPEALSAEKLAIQLATDYVQSGRKTLIVAQAGEHLQQARDIAAELNRRYKNGLIQPHRRFEFRGEDIACAVGKFANSQTEQDIERMRTGERLIMSTVATGNEGLDIPDLDALVLIGPQGADWRVAQWIGRIGRPSGRTAIASEIFPYETLPGRPLASIFHQFELPDGIITAGYYIGPGSDESPEPAPPRTDPGDMFAKFNAPPRPAPGREDQPPDPADSAAHLASLALKYLGPEPPGEARRTAASPTEPPSDAFKPSPTMSSALLRGVSLREATIAPADLAKLPPANYKPLTELPDEDAPPEGVPIEWLYAILDKAADQQAEPFARGQITEDELIRYVGTWVPGETDDEPRYLRYYSPAGLEYFRTHRIPELVRDTEMIDDQIAELLHTSRRHVRELIKQLGIEPLPRITKRHRSPKYYGMEDIIRIGIEVDKTPLADETDIPVPDLYQTIHEDFVDAYTKRHGIATPRKRRSPVWGIVGITRHVDESDANDIIEAYRALAVADPKTHINYPQIAARAGVSLSTVFNRRSELAEDELPETTWLRSAPGVRASEFVPLTWGNVFIESIMPQKVLPWEYSLGMIARYFGQSKQNISFKIGRREDMPAPEKWLLPGVSETVLYPAAVILAFLKEGMEPAAGMPVLLAARAALTADHSTDEERITYSQAIQQLLAPERQIVDRDQIAAYLDRRLHPPKLPKRSPVPQPESEPTLPATSTQTDAPKPSVTPTPTPAAEPIPDTTSAPEDSWVDAETVRVQNDCNPAAFSILLRQVGLTDDQVLRGSKNEYIGFSSDGVEAIHRACRGVGIPRPGWTRLRLVANVISFGRNVTEEEVMGALSELETTRKRPLSDDEISLARNNGRTVEVYIVDEVKRQLLQHFRAKAREENEALKTKSARPRRGQNIEERLTPEQITGIVAMRRAGTSHTVICAEFNVTAAQLTRLLRLYDQ